MPTRSTFCPLTCLFSPPYGEIVPRVERFCSTETGQIHEGGTPTTPPPAAARDETIPEQQPTRNKYDGVRGLSTGFETRFLLPSRRACGVPRYSMYVAGGRDLAAGMSPACLVGQDEPGTAGGGEVLGTKHRQWAIRPWVSGDCKAGAHSRSATQANTTPPKTQNIARDFSSRRVLCFGCVPAGF